MALPDSRNDRDLYSWRDAGTSVSHTKRAVNIENTRDEPGNVSTGYEKILEVIGKSKWLYLSVYDQVVFASNAARTSITAQFYQDGYVTGLATISITDDLNWSFTLLPYINESDGTFLLLEDGSELILE